MVFDSIAEEPYAPQAPYAPQHCDLTPVK
jgi:hypothetical protein